MIYLIDITRQTFMMSSSPPGIVHHYYSAGFIVLSYIVSVTGCWTSLELLSRKTSKNGLYNWYVQLVIGLYLRLLDVRG